ncbi:MAG: hypothetical protein EA374_06925 [Acholeplasmatales bacterium]|nr:MAG: hypothetical protein EA374_06925 [Acholeplasmatales bacterium]
MNKDKQTQMQLIAMGYVTHLLYLLVVIMLVIISASRHSALTIISAVLIPGLISMALATRIIALHHRQASTLTKTLPLLAVAQIPSLMGLVLAFVLLGQS